jgi:hypothetical protein
MNYHIEVRFDDGITWIARIRRLNATSPRAALRYYIIQSEVANLMFLGQTKVPAPQVYDFALEHPGNPVGIGFTWQVLEMVHCNWGPEKERHEPARRYIY